PTRFTKAMTGTGSTTTTSGFPPCAMGPAGSSCRGRFTAGVTDTLGPTPTVALTGMPVPTGTVTPGRMAATGGATGSSAGADLIAGGDSKAGPIAGVDSKAGPMAGADSRVGPTAAVPATTAGRIGTAGAARIA